MSSNAVSEDGQLVNIDGTGNRVAAMVYGPKSVIVIAGINKIVKTQDDALARVRMLAALLMFSVSSVKNSLYGNRACADCNAPDCICNYILTTRRCKPKENQSDFSWREFGLLKILLSQHLLRQFFISHCCNIF